MQHKITIRLTLFLAALLMMNATFAQDGQQPNVITTAVPFLLIPPDARAGGLGDVGVASTPDAFSIYWNPAKYAFIEKDFGAAIGYMPWLRGLVNDIGLASVAGYKRFGDKQAIAMSLRFFSMGKVMFTDEQGNDLMEVQPSEWTIDATYARKFTRTLSGAIAFRFIYSNLVPVNYSKYDVEPGMSGAADIALYYHKELNIKGLANAWINFGFDISNIGAKISYSSSSTLNDFLPTNLRLGPSFTMDIDDYNRLSFEIDLNKLLVPTSPIYYPDSIGPDGKKVIEKGRDPDVSVVQGMIQSFYDAPYGFKEELEEIQVSVGVEYWYNQLFAIRAGYFWESKYKGDRQFFTLGAGLRYNVFGLDFSYLIPVKNNNPLQNTLQFTLLFNFDRVKPKAERQSRQ
jgi:hypothetical protein